MCASTPLQQQTGFCGGVLEKSAARVSLMISLLYVLTTVMCHYCVMCPMPAHRPA